jgi:glycosyltransferase involved in cell wall biosynthesis
VLFIQQALAYRLIIKTINKPFFLHGRLLRKFDIIQLHEVRGLQLAASWKFYHNRPLVYTRRVDNMPSNHAFTRFKYNQVDRLVTISKKIKSVMIEWGFDPGRISVIPSAVGAEKKSDQAGRVQKLKQRFCGYEVVGCVAALEKRKDHFTLLKVAALIKRHRKDVVFLLIGDGTLRAELEARAREMDLDNVVFEGFQDDPYSYYPIFDVFLMTSKSEGLGSAILDSFSCRIPVVATAAGGIPDIVKHEQTGLLAPVQNPEMIAQLILKILDDTNLRMRVTQNAYHLVKRDYCITKMAKAYGNIYQELVSG